MKRFSILLLLSALLLASCGGAPEPPAPVTAEAVGGDASAPAAADAPVTGPETGAVCEVPDGLDYGGYVFTVLAYNYEYMSAFNDVTSDTVSGEVIEDALFERASRLLEKMNAKPESRQSDDVSAAVRKAVLAGADEFDALDCSPLTATGAVTGGYLLDTAALPYVDLGRPWWNAGAAEELSVGGKRFFLNGDIDVNDNSATWGLVFNKQLCAEFCPDEDLYTQVLNGVWTLERMNALCEDITADLNGDGVLDKEDRWGFVNSRNFSLALLEGSGEKIVTRGSDGGLVYNNGSDRLLNVMAMIAEGYSDRTKQFVCDLQADGWAAAPVIFSEGRALLRTITVKDIKAMRDMEQEFGVIPVPKYEESQDGYCSLYHYTLSYAYSVPVTLTDPERTGAVLEYLCFASADTLRPAYYDVTLSGKYAWDDESAAMLDIIFDNAVYDVGLNYDLGFYDKVKVVLTGDAGSIASGLAELESAMNESVKKLQESVLSAAN